MGIKKYLLLFVIIVGCFSGYGFSFSTMPLDFSFYSAPQRNGNQIGADLSYRWNENQTSILKARQDTLTYNFSYDAENSLVVVYEEANRIDFLAFEWEWSMLNLSLGALWMNNFHWEKGFIQEELGDDIFVFEEIKVFTLLAPRVGLKYELGVDLFKINLHGYLSPVFMVLQDQDFDYTFGDIKETETQIGDGIGFFGIDGKAELELLRFILADVDMTYYTYGVAEYSFGSFGDPNATEDYFVEDVNIYTRLQVSGGLSLLIPLPVGRLQLGGSVFYRSFTSTLGSGNYQEHNFGLLLGFRPGR